MCLQRHRAETETTLSCAEREACGREERACLRLRRPHRPAAPGARCRLQGLASGSRALFRSLAALRMTSPFRGGVAPTVTDPRPSRTAVSAGAHLASPRFSALPLGRVVPSAVHRAMPTTEPGRSGLPTPGDAGQGTRRFLSDPRGTALFLLPQSVSYRLRLDAGRISPTQNAWDQKCFRFGDVVRYLRIRPQI